MNKYLIIALLSLMGISQMTAQENEYVPFVREGVQWVCYYNHINSYDFKDVYFHIGKNYFTLEIKGDTVIDGKTYKAMHKYCGDAINPENDTVLVYLREEDRIVYGIVPGGRTYPDFYIRYGPKRATNVDVQLNAGKEFILLNFKDPESYYGQVCNHFQPYLLDELGIDEVAFGQSHVKRHKFRIRNMYDYYVIEGVGVDGFHAGYPLSYLNINEIEPPYYLSHIIENGKVVYKSVNYGDVVPYDGRMPLAREGMTWVNERVIIDHGDTTSYYYSYEIRGDNVHTGKFIGKLCHYYKGNGIGIDIYNDSIISILLEGDQCIVNCVDNKPLQNVMDENRNMLKFPGNIEENYFSLYYLDHNLPSMMDSYISWNIKQEGYPATLNYNNFIMVDPIEVDGYTCYRYAYVDEQGNPKCYVTEGIGFDSYDMGDLLTPFTRKPDPDAEYQEYWGLSHVIKDGKIIYKGMRYREPKPESLSGDYNGDGKLSIEDVTALINLLLHGSSHQLNDYNGDGSLSISDVTALINSLLAH